MMPSSSRTLRAKRRRHFVALLALPLLAGCTIGPDYKEPPAEIPAAYKEAGWQIAQPADAIDRGAWWSVYRDPVLDALERQIDISNQNLKSAEAAYRQATAIVAQARSGFFPTLTFNASATRSRNPGGGSGAGGSGTGGSGAGGSGVGTGGGGGGNISNAFALSGSAGWTPDLWGRIRRTVESDVANAQASAGDLASARLSAQGQLASDYMQLRVADELKRLLQSSVAAYTESVRITRNQFNSGTADQSAVAQAEAQLESTRAQLVAIGVTRSQLEHAIAVLIGKPPSTLTLAPATAAIAIPAAPGELPAALLQRRPDIAAAERRMAAANAQIGVAETAFFPNVTLSADYGVAAAMLDKLLTASSRMWSFGGTLAETLFDAGGRHAIVEQQRALFDAAIADYRQTVLTGFQQVEDELAALRILADQAKAQEAALAAAREAERIINNQYKAGTVAYTSVIVAETTALADAETVVNIRQSRLVASVALIQALGGGWDAAQLPSRDRIERDSPLNFSPLPPADALPKFP
ncbi:MAG TPA: efflux transporter outer membrane subunit [Stellaceae bacterium]|jgi:NodT family efflux transporter outer membrane factor (OMF) lipoprotein|nr:efflux transporter outer membrane subunit [Stellaceae bacterium]